MNDADRDRFDELVAAAIELLPERFRFVLDEVPIVVLDRPTPTMLKDLGLAGDPHAADELMGLHTGVSITEESVERSGELPDQIHLFRRGHLHALDLEQMPTEGEEMEDLAEQVRITLLHEIGHHMGLEEDDLERLGYD